MLWKQCELEFLMMPASSNRLLEKASCLFQNTKSKNRNFYFSREINDLSIANVVGTSMYR